MSERPAVAVMVAAQKMWERMQGHSWVSSPDNRIIPWNDLDQADQLELLTIADEIIGSYIGALGATYRPGP